MKMGGNRFQIRGGSMKKLKVTFFGLLLVLLGASWSVQAQVTLSASPSGMNFDLYVGQSSTKYSYVYINNYSDGSVSLNVTDSCSTDYRVGTTCYGMYWNTGSCDIRVEFTPKSVGNSSCYVRVYGSPGGYTDVYVTGRARPKTNL